MLSYGDLRPSEVVHLTIPDPAEQAPLVARSVTPPSPSGRGGTTLLRQRAPRSCTVFVMTPPNEHTSEGGRDDRGVPYHAESTLSGAHVLKLVTRPEGRAWSEARSPRARSGSRAGPPAPLMTQGARILPEFFLPQGARRELCCKISEQKRADICRRAPSRDCFRMYCVREATTWTADYRKWAKRWGK